MLVNGRDDCDPDPSPDGTRLAFASRLGGGPSSIWVADADGTHPRRVTRGGTDFKLAWSPDGSRIAFERQHGPNDYELLVVNADGTGLRSIRGGPGFDGTPDWSPTDGDLLIGSSGRKGLGSAAIRCKGSALYRLDPEGSNVRRLTRCGRESILPQWSPDGSALAWARGTPYGGPFALAVDGCGHDRPPDPRPSRRGRRLVSRRTVDRVRAGREPLRDQTGRRRPNPADVEFR